MSDQFNQALYDAVMAREEEPELQDESAHDWWLGYRAGADSAARIAAERQSHLESQIDALAQVLMDEFGGPIKSESACEMAVRVLREQAAERVPVTPAWVIQKVVSYTSDNAGTEYVEVELFGGDDDRYAEATGITENDALAAVIKAAEGENT